MQAIPSANHIPTPATVPVAIYTRVSTANQVGGRFDSCESQAVICRDHITKQTALGWCEVACFSDPAYSGSSMNRPGIRALMRLIESGEVKVVLIFKLERVLRSTDEWGPFRSFLQKHGCKLVSPTEDLSDETPSGRLKNNLLMSVAEYERLNTAEKIRLKLNEQAKRGFWTGGVVPYGYRYDEKLQGLSPEPVEAAVIVRIFELAARLVGLAEIANTLNDEGLRTRVRHYHSRDGQPLNIGDRRFRTDILRRLITRPLYAGRVCMNGQVFAGKHQALVSIETWEQANAAINKRINPPKRRFTDRDKHFHLLKGIAYCGSCGRALIPSASGKHDPNGKPYRYYTCGYLHKERTDAACPVRHIAAGSLELAVMGFLGQCSQHPEIVQATLERVLEHRQTDRTPLRARLTEVETSLETIAGQLRNCAQAIVNGGLASLSETLRIEADALHQQKQRLLIEREQLRADLAECEQGGLDAVRIRQSLARFSEIMPTLSLGQQRDLVALFLERVDVRPSKTPGKVAAGTRLLELRLKLRVARLIEGMEERLVIEQRESEPVTRGRALALTLEVALAQAGNPVPVSILAPFRCDLGTRKPSTAVKPDLPAQHAIHRARAWQRRLDAETGLLRITLAAEERVSPATVTQHLKLLELDQDLQAHLLNLTKESEVRCFSLNQLTRLAGLPLDEQKRRFADLNQPKAVCSN
jgi:DNA invertase Pin-like site-specific DNA recombinase